MAAHAVIDLSSSPAGTQSRNPPSSHRLATVSASDALQDLESTGSNYIRTGLPSLDAALGGANLQGDGGLERRKITEIWGPNGAGTTGFALQAGANALKDGYAVMWVDCATPLSKGRLEALLAPKDPEGASTDAAGNALENLRRLSAPTLTHLLALVLNPPSNLLAEDTALLVIDNLNTLVDLDYPRAQAVGSNRTDSQKWQANRRYAVLGSLVTALSKLAAVNNLAVVATTGCAMRTRPDSGLGGALAPGIGGAEWDAGIWNRLVIFRDFAGRFVGVQKCGGKSLIPREEAGEPGRIIGFDIDAGSGALRERQPGQAANGAPQHAKVHSSPVKSRKRYFDEVADSDDEDEYGWGEGDEEVFAADTLATAAGATNGQNEGS